ncbi:Oidioi.mRNA.OKI2018_I69.chr1.g364.t1.cds [Oikopleura dioica]|uniref:DNA sliding clamp PCNA n=1 Tax=Oikopleura dioica TaxID=34765 RepID=A0ABN7SJM8_OIKDI|nr:Oidioi.mRNA.OKI2018_I69.chr1.g364.t1.cds [Oikopleura dioica]
MKNDMQKTAKQPSKVNMKEARARRLPKPDFEGFEDLSITPIKKAPVSQTSVSGTISKRKPLPAANIPSSGNQAMGEKSVTFPDIDANLSHTNSSRMADALSELSINRVTASADERTHESDGEFIGESRSTLDKGQNNGKALVLDVSTSLHKTPGYRRAKYNSTIAVLSKNRNALMSSTSKIMSLSDQVEKEKKEQSVPDAVPLPTTLPNEVLDFDLDQNLASDNFSGHKNDYEPSDLPRNADGNGTGSGDGNGTGSGDGGATGSGDGRATGSGDGNGTGSGDGNGTGSGDGRATGSGDGRATGSGDGRATGDGDGRATGDGDGRATGDGDGEEVHPFCRPLTKDEDMIPDPDDFENAAGNKEGAVGGRNQQIKIDVDVPRMSIHSFISNQGNPSLYMVFHVPIKDLPDSMINQRQPKQRNTKTWHSIKNKRRQNWEKKQKEVQRCEPATTVPLYFLFQRNRITQNVDGSISYSMKCSKCSARQTFYAPEILFIKGKKKGDFDVNPDYSHCFFDTAKTEPMSTFCRPPQPQYHDCSGLSFDEAGEEVYERNVLKLVHDVGLGVKPDMLKTLTENVQRTFPGWSPKKSPEVYARTLTQSRYRLKQRILDDFKTPDDLCKLVPQLYSDLPHLLTTDKNNMMESRWPLFQSRKCLIVGNTAILKKLPKRAYQLCMIDGTFFVAGAWRQLITFSMSFPDGMGNEKFVMVASIYMLSQAEEDYREVFGNLWDVLFHKFPQVASHLFCQTDAEAALYNGIEKGFADRGVQAYVFLCTTHTERANFRRLKKILRWKEAPPAARLCLFLLKMLQFLRPDLIYSVMQYLFCVFSRVPHFGRRLAFFIKSLCHRIIQHKWGKRFSYWRLMLILRHRIDGLRLNTNPSESLNNSLNSAYRAKFGRRRANFLSDLQVLFEYFEASGSKALKGEFIEYYADPAYKNRNQALIKKVMEHCESIDRVPIGEPVGKEWFLTWMDICLDFYKTNEKKNRRKNHRLYEQMQRENLVATLESTCDFSVNPPPPSVTNENENNIDNDDADMQVNDVDPNRPEVPEGSNDIFFGDTGYNCPEGPMSWQPREQTAHIAPEISMLSVRREVERYNFLQNLHSNDANSESTQLGQSVQRPSPGSQTAASNSQLASTSGGAISQFPQNSAIPIPTSVPGSSAASLPDCMVDNPDCELDEDGFPKFKNPFESSDDDDAPLVNAAQDGTLNSQSAPTKENIPPQANTIHDPMSLQGDVFPENNAGGPMPGDVNATQIDTATKVMSDGEPESSPCNITDGMETSPSENVIKENVPGNSRDDAAFKNAISATLANPGIVPAKESAIARNPRYSNSSSLIGLNEDDIPSLHQFEGKNKKQRFEEFDRGAKRIDKESRDIDLSAAISSFSRHKEKRLSDKTLAKHDRAEAKYMFEAKFKKAETLKRIVDSVNPLLGAVFFNIKPEGIAMQSMDSGQVTLIQLVLRKQGFEHFRCDKEILLGVNITHLQKILKNIQPNETLLLQGSENDEIDIVFGHESAPHAYTYHMKLMEIDCEALDIPANNYCCSITMPTSEFDNLIKFMSTGGEYVKVDATSGQVIFSSEGQYGTAEMPFTELFNEDPKNKLLVVDVKESICSDYILQYLQFFSKACCLSENTMLICKFKRAFHMKSVCKTLGSLMEECVIKSDANGLTFLSTDASMSTYITVNFNIAGFLQYLSSGTIYLGVSLKGINNVLNSIPNDSPLEILCDSECPDDFIIGSVDKIGVPMRFNMKVLELDLEEVNRPELAYGATVILSSARFQRDMLHLKNVADKTKITVSEGEVTFSAVDADRMNIVLEETDVMA